MPRASGGKHNDEYSPVSTKAAANAIPWFQALGVIFLLAIAWGAIFMWAELVELLIEKVLKLPSGSAVSKLITATIFTSIFLLILFVLGGPQHITEIIGNPSQGQSSPPTVEENVK